MPDEFIDAHHHLWQELILDLAKRENVYCKLSRMVTEADWNHWTESDLQPYFDIILTAFGPKRLMYDSDWPVVLMACGYRRWADMVRSWISELSASEQSSIMGGTARLAYSL
jgi:L-fuconolactonase